MPPITLATAADQARQLERSHAPDLHDRLRYLARLLLAKHDGDDTVLWQLHDLAVAGLPRNRAHRLSYAFNYALDGLGSWRA